MQSMTGFADHLRRDSLELRVSLRSVNHRFSTCSVDSPSATSWESDSLGC